jgi:hypothetical protein
MAAESIVKKDPKLDAVLADDRELQDLADRTPFLPFTPFEVEVTLLDCHPKRNSDNAGVFATVRIDSSNVPEVAVGRLYCLVWFSAHPKQKPFQIGQQLVNRGQFCAAIEGVPYSNDYVAQPQLRKLDAAVGDLNIKLGISRVFARKTRNNVDLYDTFYRKL